LSLTAPAIAWRTVSIIASRTHESEGKFRIIPKEPFSPEAVVLNKVPAYQLL